MTELLFIVNLLISYNNIDPLNLKLESSGENFDYCKLDTCYKVWEFYLPGYNIQDEKSANAFLTDKFVKKCKDDKAPYTLLNNDQLIDTINDYSSKLYECSDNLRYIRVTSTYVRCPAGPTSFLNKPNLIKKTPSEKRSKDTGKNRDSKVDSKSYVGHVICEKPRNNYTHIQQAIWNVSASGTLKNFFDLNSTNSKICHKTYNGCIYRAFPKTYALSRCPDGKYGFSWWYCAANLTFIDVPNYSLCCKIKKLCFSEDEFGHVWIACPTKTAKKTLRCPCGTIKGKAEVKWYCMENGTFEGNSPDYGNCYKKKCSKTDKYGTEWSVIINETETKPCPFDYSGTCKWTCNENGEFDTPEPDCSRCLSNWMKDIYDKIHHEHHHVEIMENMENYTANNDLILGYENVINLTNACVDLFEKQYKEDKNEIFENFLLKYVKIFKNIALNETIWSEFKESGRMLYADELVSITQRATFSKLKKFSENVKKHSKSNYYNSTLASMKTDGFDFVVMYHNSAKNLKFPIVEYDNSDWQIEVQEIDDSQPAFAAMGLRMNESLTSLMFPQGKNSSGMKINGPTVTLTIATYNKGKRVLVSNVTTKFVFKHFNKTRKPETEVIKRKLYEGEIPSGVYKSTFCYIYDKTDWNKEGCSWVYSTEWKTECICSHLSTISLLMSIHKYEPDTLLEMVSLVSSGITIVSLSITLIVFFIFRTNCKERIFIGKNLCFCLLVGHILLITVMDKKFFYISDSYCTVYAILLHYVFMAAFAWMFIEGYHLYRMLVVVFNSTIKLHWIYSVIGYGLPLCIVGITLLLGLIFKIQPYGQDELCWLKAPHFIWAFTVPVVILMSINLAILIFSVKLAVASKKRMEKSKFVGIRLWMKGWISLSAVLGITWLFGLAYIHYNEPFIYCFVVLNGLQGFFIFLFRCVLNEQYRALIYRLFKSDFSKFSISGKSSNINKTKLDFSTSNESETKTYTDSRKGNFANNLSQSRDKKNLNKVTSEKEVVTTEKLKKEETIIVTAAKSEAYLRMLSGTTEKSSEKNITKDYRLSTTEILELSYHYNYGKDFKY